MQKMVYYCDKCKREIKKILRESGLYQQDLSEKMGMSRTGLTLVLNGKKPCTEKVANKIADALGIPIERFAKEEVKAIEEESL